MTRRERNLGIELLRIICMLTMVIQHILGHGWVIAMINPESWKFEFAVALRSACLFGISGFALISGYVGVNSRFRYSSVVLQWTKVWLYSVVFMALDCVIHQTPFSIWEWKGMLLPTLHKLYWYFTAYVGCSMVAPLLRRAIRQLDFKQATVCCVTLVCVFSVLTNVVEGDAFYTNEGKGVMWLVVLYILGAYLGWFRPHEKIPMAALWALAVCSVLLLAGLQPVARRLGLAYFAGDPKNSSLHTLLAAVSMLMLFSRVQITRFKKPIAILGGASFSVYLLHEHPKIRLHTISKYSYLLAELNIPMMLAGTILAAMVIYVACTLVDLVRERIYRALRIRQRLDALETRLIGDLWAD